jgi:adenylate cyclase
VRCAIEIQQGAARRAIDVAEDQRIAWRIGINLGDVIAEGSDLYGDGVNIAARLEGLAETGGICVSRAVRDQVRDRLSVSFVDLVEQQGRLQAGGVADSAWSPHDVWAWTSRRTLVLQ